MLCHLEGSLLILRLGLNWLLIAQYIFSEVFFGRIFRMFYTQITSESTHDSVAIFTLISKYSKPIIELIENTYEKIHQSKC